MDSQPTNDYSSLDQYLAKRPDRNPSKPLNSASSRFMDAVPEIPGQARPHIETVGHIDELIIAPKIWHQLDQASLHRRIMDLARADPYATLRGMIEEVVDDVTPVGTLIRTNSPFNPEVEIRYARAARVAQFFAENHAPIGGYDCDTPLMAVLSTIRLLFDKRYSKRWFEVDRKDDYMLDTSFFEMLENMGFYEAIKPVDYQQVLNELESDDRIIQRGIENSRRLFILWRRNKKILGQITKSF